MKSAEFQTVCIFGQNFHNCRSRVEVVAEAERKRVEPASASLSQNVASSSLTEIKYETEKINNIQNISTNKRNIHLDFHFLLIIDLQFLHEVGENFSGLDFKGIPLLFLACLLRLLGTRRYLVFIGEDSFHLLQSLYNWVRLINN